MSESPVEALKELVTAEEGKLLTWAGKAGGMEEYVVATEGEGKPQIATYSVGNYNIPTPEYIYKFTISVKKIDF